MQAWKDLSQGRGRIKLVEFSMTAIGHHLPASHESSQSGHIRMPFCYKLSLLTPVLMTGKSTLSHYPVLWTSEADAISLVIPEHTASPPGTGIPHQTPYPWNWPFSHISSEFLDTQSRPSLKPCSGFSHPQHVPHDFNMSSSHLSQTIESLL